MIVGQVCLKEISQEPIVGNQIRVITGGSNGNCRKTLSRIPWARTTISGTEKGSSRLWTCHEALFPRIPAAARSTGIIHVEPGTRHGARSGAQSSCAGVAG